MSPPNAPRIKKDRHLKKGRALEIEAKKKLLQFLKDEFAAKKPIEIRLLRLKPQVVFQKGSLLPSLLIKSLQQTAFTMYLDYGEDIRFYFFDLGGDSLGASTFPKSEKMLKELHGKAITLYKLPKVSANDGFDQQSIKITEKSHKYIAQYQEKWQINIKNPPSYSVSENPIKMNSIRFGITQHENIFHISQDIVGEHLENFVLLRELFCVLTRLDPRDSYTQILATLWAYCELQEVDAPPFLSIFKDVQFAKKLQKKFKDWFLNVFQPMTESSSHFRDHFSSFLEKITRSLVTLGIFQEFSLNQVLLFYMMQSSKEQLTQSITYTFQPFAEEFYLSEVFTLIYSRKELILRYDIPIGKFLGDFYLWIFYFMAYTNFQATTESLDEMKPVIPAGLEKHQRELTEIRTFWFNKEFMLGYNQIEGIIASMPAQDTPIKSWATDYIQQSIMFQLKTIGIVSRGPSLLKLEKNGSQEFTVHIQNRTDVILTRKDFFIELQPQKAFQVQILEKPTTSVFDTQLKFHLRCQKIEDNHKGEIKIVGIFEYPFDREQKINLSLWEGNVE